MYIQLIVEKDLLQTNFLNFIKFYLIKLHYNHFEFFFVIIDTKDSNKTNVT